jgi:hypothetical protein
MSTAWGLAAIGATEVLRLSWFKTHPGLRYLPSRPCRIQALVIKP